jgi:hypothetical protein
MGRVTLIEPNAGNGLNWQQRLRFNYRLLCLYVNVLVATLMSVINDHLFT